MRNDARGSLHMANTCEKVIPVHFHHRRQPNQQAFPLHNMRDGEKRWLSPQPMQRLPSWASGRVVRFVLQLVSFPTYWLPDDCDRWSQDLPMYGLNVSSFQRETYTSARLTKQNNFQRPYGVQDRLFCTLDLGPSQASPNRAPTQRCRIQDSRSPHA